MDTDIHRSTSVPVDVTIRSEQEPALTRGVYRKLVGGFALEFNIDDSKYNITCVEGKIKLSVDGLLSYSLDFSAPAEVELKTAIGSMKYDFEPVTSSSTEGGESIDLLLVYKLGSVETGEITRNVCVSARLDRARA